MQDKIDLDKLFSELNKQPQVVLSEYLRSNCAVSDNNLIFQIRELVRDSKLANVRDVDTDLHKDAIISLNGNGIKSLNNKTYSEYLKQQESVKDKPFNSIIITAPVTGSQIGQSSDLARLDMKSKKDIQQTPIDTPKKKSNHDIWDKIKYVSAIIGGLGVAIAAVTKILEIW